MIKRLLQLSLITALLTACGTSDGDDTADAIAQPPTTAPDLAGTTWVSRCLVVDAVTSARATYQYEDEEVMLITIAIYSDDGCAIATEVEAIERTYEIGDRAALDHTWQIDYTTVETGNVSFQIVRVIGPEMLIGDPVTGDTETAGTRPTTLNESTAFTRQGGTE